MGVCVGGKGCLTSSGCEASPINISTLKMARKWQEMSENNECGCAKWAQTWPTAPTTSACNGKQDVCPITALHTPPFKQPVCPCDKATCRTCGDGRCTACTGDLILHDGVCAKDCPPGHVQASTRVGKQCVATVPKVCGSNPNPMSHGKHCASCHGSKDGACGYCKTGYFLHLGACVEHCPPTFDPHESVESVPFNGVQIQTPATCVGPCDTIRHCSRCATQIDNVEDAAHQVCGACTKGYMLARGACVTAISAAASRGATFTRLPIDVPNGNFEGAPLRVDNVIPRWSIVGQAKTWKSAKTNGNSNAAMVSSGILTQKLSYTPKDNEKYVLTVSIGAEPGYKRCLYRIRIMSGNHILVEANGEVSALHSPKEISLSVWSRATYTEPLVLWLEGVPPQHAPSTEGYIVTFDNVKMAVYETRAAVCPVSDQAKCRVDVVLALDVSGSLSTQITAVKNVAIETIKQLDLRHTRVAIVSFHESAKLEFDFNEHITPPGSGHVNPNFNIAHLFFKMAENLDLRCVLVPAPWVLGPKHVSNPE